LCFSRKNFFFGKQAPEVEENMPVQKPGQEKSPEAEKKNVKSQEKKKGKKSFFKL